MDAGDSSICEVIDGNHKMYFAINYETVGGTRMNRRKQKNGPLIVLLSVLIVVMLLLVAVCITMMQKKDASANEKNTTQETTPVQEETTPLQEATTEEETPVAASNGHTVCIDPGHGGYDRGSEALGYAEAAQAYKLGMLVQKELESRGYAVVMTRTDDNTKVTLDERVATCNNSAAEIMVSIHRNKYDGTEEVSGMEAWIGSSDPEDAHALAKNILDNLLATNTMRDRGIKTGTEGNAGTDYAINRGCNVASVILELGFISNKSDNNYYEKNIDAYAKAIADGIDGYFSTYNVTQ